MSVSSFFPKQVEVLKSRPKRWNILSGGTGAGKTEVSLIKFVLEVAKCDMKDEFLICGKTLTTLERNCLNKIKDTFPEFCSFSLKNKKGKIFGRTCYLEGVYDSKSQENIRGMTIKGAYCDEVVTYNKDFMDMLKSRMRVINPFAYLTCNPDHPKHWFNIEFRENSKIEKNVWDFALDDNVFLPKDFIENIKNEYVDVLYDRYVLGKWVAAEGSIYKTFSKTTNVVDKIPYDEIIFYVAGVDIGGSQSQTAFVLTGFTDNFKKIFVVDEFKLPADNDANSIIEAFKNISTKWKKTYGNKFNDCFVDSAASTFIKSFSILNIIDVYKSRKVPILERISQTQMLFSNSRLLINKSCVNLISAFETAVWDTKHSVKYDKRLDDGRTCDIDILDAFEYSFEGFIDYLKVGGLN